MFRLVFMGKAHVLIKNTLFSWLGTNHRKKSPHWPRLLSRFLVYLLQFCLCFSDLMHLNLALTCTMSSTAFLRQLRALKIRSSPLNSAQTDANEGVEPSQSWTKKWTMSECPNFIPFYSFTKCYCGLSSWGTRFIRKEIYIWMIS